MCGIAGIVTRDRIREEQRVSYAQGIYKSLFHRGPDFQNDYLHNNVWLGHVRLSIIDITSAGNQPMVSENQQCIVSFNGEIYNYHELSTEFGFLKLKSASDTEVLLRMYEKVGVNSFLKFNGIFAFAIYDRLLKKLFLVRDRLGVKPLYYKIGYSGIAFSSEIKGIISLDPSSSVFDITSLHEWLYFGNTLNGNTFFKGIRQVPAGSFLEFDLSTFTCRINQFWSIKKQSQLSRTNKPIKSEQIEVTRSLIEKAVQRQLVSDVPVGIFLSGGIDSSTITAFASKHYNGRISTYSADFDFSNSKSELLKAKRIANYFGTQHNEIHIQGNEIGNLVEKMIYHHDMPFSDAANIPLFLLASKINNHTKVVLQGDGGDELFGGYRRFSILSYYKLFRNIAPLLSQINKFGPKNETHYRIQRMINVFTSSDKAKILALLLTVEDTKSNSLRIFDTDFQKHVRKSDPFYSFKNCQASFCEYTIVDQLFYVDMLLNLPDIYLEKVDRSTMAATIEARVPLLDNDLVDYVLRIPAKEKIPFGKKKWLLKEAMRDILPQEVLERNKSGFGVPFEDWLNKPLKPMFFDHLSKFNHDQPGVLNIEYINEIYSQTSEHIHNHSYLLWKIFNLVIWANNTKIVIGP